VVLVVILVGVGFISTMLNYTVSIKCVETDARRRETYDESHIQLAKFTSKVCTVMSLL